MLCERLQADFQAKALGRAHAHMCFKPRRGNGRRDSKVETDDVHAGDYKIPD